MEDVRDARQARPADGVPGGQVPQRGGVLGGGAGDRDPAGRRVHAGVRLLRRCRRDTRSARSRGAEAGGGRGGGALLAARGRHLRHPRRPPRTAVRRTSTPGRALRGKRRATSKCWFGISPGTSTRSVRRRPPPRLLATTWSRPAPRSGGSGRGVGRSIVFPPRRRDASLPSVNPDPGRFGETKGK